MAWIKFDSLNGSETWRLATPSGWIVVDILNGVIRLTEQVSDPDHVWNNVPPVVEPPVVVPPVVVPPVVVPPVVVPPVVVPPTTTKFLGTNLTFLEDYETEIPFANVLLTSRSWISTDGSVWDDGRPLDVDADLNIKSLLAGQKAKTLFFWDHAAGAHKNGRYILTYNGTGTFEFSGSAKIVSKTAGRYEIDIVDGGAQMLISAVDPTNYPKNVKLVHVDNKHPLLNDDFVATISKYGTLRMMDWARTNGSQQKTANQIPTENSFRVTAGISPELAGAVAASVSQDVWLCVPHQADDNYVKTFFTRLKPKLLPTQKVYVEYSNEVWNGGFPQQAWIRSKGESLGLGTGYDAAMHYHGVRTAEVGALAKGILGADRVVTVLGMQASNSWWITELLKYQNLATKIDAVAIAPYFGSDLGNSQGGVTAAGDLNALFTAIETKAIPEAVGWMKACKAACVAAKVRLICYEGGQHLAGVGSWQNNATLNSLFNQANADARMGAMYDIYLTAVKKEIGDLFVHFNNCGRWSKYGYWGAQEILTKETPKSLSLKKFA